MESNTKPTSDLAVTSSDLLAESPWFPLTPEEMIALRNRIMSESPKTKAEWWARREIIDLMDCIHKLTVEDSYAYPALEHAKRIGERYSANAPS